MRDHHFDKFIRVLHINYEVGGRQKNLIFQSSCQMLLDVRLALQSNSGYLYISFLVCCAHMVNTGGLHIIL